jgi:hypothetical protein
LLVRTLVERQQHVSFFNELLAEGAEPWIPAAQFFGTEGFFHDYNIRAGEGLKDTTGRVWADGFAQLRRGQLDPNALARAVAQAEQGEGKEMTAAEFAALLSPKAPPLAAKARITRESALRQMFSLLP